MATEDQMKLLDAAIAAEYDERPELPTVAGLPFSNADALRVQLKRYGETREVFLTWIESQLVAGTDWQLIHRKVGGQPCPNKAEGTQPKCAKCGGKSTLCKPGSEKICGLLQLTPRFRRDAETIEMIGNEGTLAFVCELYDASGRLVAEGRGARSIGQDMGDANKCVKMCQKSAQIDATLRLAGLSEVFTQDLEDLPPLGDEPGSFQQAPPRRATSAAAAPVEQAAPPASAPVPPDAILPAKQGVVWARMRAALAAKGKETPKMVEAVSRELDRLVGEATHGARTSWKQVSWRKDGPMGFQQLLDAIDATVARVTSR